MIEFEDAAHEAIAAEIATRLGFALVDVRLQLFARRIEPAEPVPPSRPGARKTR